MGVSDAASVDGVIGDKAASQLDAGFVDHDDGVATMEIAVDARDAGRQQAASLLQRPDGAGVDG